ncbi:hypothetical protein HRbin08_00519 [bacterium HR08]|nr:hypothetical protein HRbin08_00519 [bacterium HR08]
MKVRAALLLLPIAREHDVQGQLPLARDDRLAGVQEHAVRPLGVDRPASDDHLAEGIHLHPMGRQRRRRPLLLVERLRVVHHIGRDRLGRARIVPRPDARIAVGLDQLRFLAPQLLERLAHQLRHLLNPHVPTAHRRLPEIALDLGDMLLLVLLNVLVDLLHARRFEDVLDEAARRLQEMKEVGGDHRPHHRSSGEFQECLPRHLHRLSLRREDGPKKSGSGAVSRLMKDETAPAAITPIRRPPSAAHIRSSDRWARGFRTHTGTPIERRAAPRCASAARSARPSSSRPPAACWHWSR